MIASCGFLEDELRQCSKEEGVAMAHSVETLGVDLRTYVKRLGVKKKREERNARPKELHEGGCQEIVTSGYGVSKNVESTCSGDGSCTKIKNDEADGISSGQRKYDLFLLTHESLLL